MVKSTSKLLSPPSEPTIYNMVVGTGPIVIIGPHNGHHVPYSLYTQSDPLGLPASWFDRNDPKKRHEACDWGMKELFNKLYLKLATTDCHFLSANYSRLVCDLNRAPDHDHWLTFKADELEIPIPGNTGISDKEKKQRKNTFYAPWFTALEYLTNIAKNNNEGSALILDLHSCTPTWRGKKRELDIGTLILNESPISNSFETLFAKACKTAGAAFEQDAPYKLQALNMQEKAAAQTLCNRFNIEYKGVEIRNNNLENQETLEAVANIITESVLNLLPQIQQHSLIRRTRTASLHTTMNAGAPVLAFTS